MVDVTTLGGVEDGGSPSVWTVGVTKMVVSTVNVVVVMMLSVAHVGKM